MPALLTALLPPPALLAAFLLASLALAATPGPGVVYIVARTLSQGRRAGLSSVLGVALGNLGNAVGAALGLAALFALSSWAFAVVKYAGAAYLLYLGWRSLRGVATEASDGQAPHFGAPDHGRIFRDGLWVALLNPKTALFFAAFLPQFLGHGQAQGPAAAQSLLLGGLFVLIAACTDSLYVLAASAAAARLGGSGDSRLRRCGRYLAAAVYVALGLFTALSGSRSPASPRG
jgi:threonine/homoserine/homoserine lactone efflux protein